MTIVETKFKEKPRWLGKAHPWTWTSFQNPARRDGLALKHWARKADPPINAMDDGDDDALSYPFARFNVKADVPTYSDTAYVQHLAAPDWTREETDYLFEMCREYDLRFPIIHDRYEFAGGPPRALEDLKARYYDVCRALLEARTPHAQMTPEELAQVAQLGFDRDRAKLRRAMAERQFSKTEDQMREEEMLLAELKRIVANQERMFEERKDLFTRLSYPGTTGSIQPYTGSQGLTHLRDMMVSTSDKSKKRKSIAMASAPEPAPAPTPTSAGPVERSSGGGGGGGGGGNATKERAVDKEAAKRQVRKLSREEEQQYGVSSHEKLSAGVKLRSGMVSSNVKGATATKVMQALTQLGISAKLTMPTARTVSKYEQLQSAVGVLLDSKKLLDKMDQEARVLKAQQEMRAEE